MDKKQKVKAVLGDVIKGSIVHPEKKQFPFVVGGLFAFATPEEKAFMEALWKADKNSTDAEVEVKNFIPPGVVDSYDLEDFVFKAGDFLRTCRDDFDCDSDAHRYNTFCRVCEAEKIIGKKEKTP